MDHERYIVEQIKEAREVRGMPIAELALSDRLDAARQGSALRAEPQARRVAENLLRIGFERQFGAHPEGDPRTASGCRQEAEGRARQEEVERK